MAKSKQNKQKGNNSNGTRDMVVRAPAAAGHKTTRPAPKVSFANNGNCVVSHSEFVADVYSGINAPLATPYTVNPQEGQTFTWLSALATRFEMYKFRKLKFRYRPSCSTTTDGYVIIGMDFDFYDTTPSKQELLAWQYTSKSSVWTESKIDVSTALGKIGSKYCDVSGAPGDLRLSHLGRFWVFTDGVASVRNLGEVYVDYEIELITPSYKIPPALYARTSNSGIPTGAFPANAQVFGNLSVVPGATTNTFKISTPGEYLIQYFCSGGSWTALAPTIGFTTPSDAPGSDFSFSSSVAQLVQGNGAGVAYYVVLAAGTVLCTLFNAGMSGTGIHTFLISTSKTLL